MVKKMVIISLLSLIWLAASWTLLRPGFFFAHDFVHGARIAEMSRALADGHFPVRWSQNFGYGYGMPLFEFYGPLPFYVGAGLLFFGLDLILVLKILFAVCNLVTVIGAYVLGRELIGRLGGVATAALITLAPYRAVNLFIRGALGEAWGMMVLPWIVLGIVLVLKQRSRGWLVLTLSLTALFLSHNLTTLMFVPLSLLFAAGMLILALVTKHQTLKTVVQVGAKIFGSYALAGGLAAFYVLPAFGEKQFTKVESIVGGYFDYTLHFLYLRQFITPGWGFGGSGWGPDDGISFFLGWPQWLSVGVLFGALGWWLVRMMLSKKVRVETQHLKRILEVGVLLGLALISLVMTIGKSQFIWDSFSFLAFIQFPWRWLSGAIIWLSLATAYSIYFVPRRTHRLVIVGIILIISLITNTTLFRPERYLDEASSLYYEDEDRIQTHMSNILQDYIPHQMAAKLDLEPTPPLPLILAPSNTHTEVMVERVHQKLIRTRFSEPSVLEVAIADFPGWYAEIDGQPAFLTQTARGNLQLEVPAGEHMVGIAFGSTPLRLGSDILSAVSLMGLLFLVLSSRVGNEKIEQHD